ncbi:MAG: LytTR family transcriptional regulator [Balneola sp.]|nr:MAG: LytTR family transcriptional regulator [Balneola sp.]
MLTKNKITLLLIISILGVIFFDALQQKFYLDTFDLYSDGEISFLFLLKLHFIRWTIWLGTTFLGISFLRSTDRLFSSDKTENWILISGLFLFLNIIALVLVSAHNILQSNTELSFVVLKEVFVFMIYQKGMSFTFASGLTLLLLFNRSKKHIIEAQWVEIQSLKDQVVGNPEKASDAHHLLIRIGSREKLIPITEITWFEADDYCVRIHTESRTYSLRKSLKSLEKDLQNFNFVRVHRRALVNLSYFEQADFNNCTVTLSDRSEIPISKSRIGYLKQVLKAASL